MQPECIGDTLNYYSSNSNVNIHHTCNEVTTYSARLGLDKPDTVNIHHPSMTVAHNLSLARVPTWYNPGEIGNPSPPDLGESSMPLLGAGKPV